MEIIIKNNEKTQIFVELFQYLKLFTTTVSISILTNKFYIQGMDSSQVSIFEITLTKEWFDKYVVEKDTVVSMNINIFAKILHIYAVPQDIHLSVNEDEMEIKFQSEGKEFDKEFVMPLIDYDSEYMVIPDKEYDLDIKIESKKLKTIVDELSIFGDTMTIKYDNENIVLTSKSETEGSMKTLMKIDDIDECVVNEELETECSFRIKYIQHMLQYHKISKYTELHFSNDTPMQCKYILDENPENYIRFYLAPIVAD